MDEGMTDAPELPDHDLIRVIAANTKASADHLNEIRKILLFFVMIAMAAIAVALASGWIPWRSFFN